MATEDMGRPEPIWVPHLVVLAAHMEQLHEHGGLYGIREDGTVLATALARPEHRFHYERDADLAALAAAYAYGLATLHPFSDGNKRTAFVVAAMFIRLNGYVVTLEERDVVSTMTALAAGRLDEAALAAWFRTGMRRATPACP